MAATEPNFNIEKAQPIPQLVESSNRPIPSDRELEWDKSKVMTSKTDSKGIILYANDAFIDVCEYDDFELVNKPQNILRHPDMPKVIFKLLWENLDAGKDHLVVFKNMSKTGRFYWVLSEIKVITTDKGDTQFNGIQKAVNANVILDVIEPLYKKLHQIENVSGLQSSENYLQGFLEEKNMNFVTYMDSVCKAGVQAKNEEAKESGKKKGFFSNFFSGDAVAEDSKVILKK